MLFWHGRWDVSPREGWKTQGLTRPAPVSRMRDLSRSPTDSGVRATSLQEFNMYAVIATGGKQYRVTKDAVLKVEKLDAMPGRHRRICRRAAGGRGRRR